MNKLCSECEELLPEIYFAEQRCRRCVKIEHLARRHNPKWGLPDDFTNESLSLNADACRIELTRRREAGPCKECGAGLVFWFRRNGECVDVFHASDSGGFSPSFLPTYLAHFNMFCAAHQPKSIALTPGKLDVEAHYRNLAFKTSDPTKKRKFLLMAAQAARKQKYARSR